MWITRDGAGTVAVNTGPQTCSIAFDVLSDAGYWKLSPEPRGGPIRETSISARPGEPDVDGSTIIIDQATGATSANHFAGVMMRTPSGDDAIFWGLTGAGSDLSYFTFSGGAFSAITVVSAAVGAGETLVLRYNGAGLYDLGRLIAGVFTVDAANVAGPAGPRWAGFGAIELVATTATYAGTFENARVYEPKAGRPFTFLAIRNPALPGAYDLEAAQAQLDRQSPAHTIPIAATTDQGLSLGPTGPGLLGSSPLFPIV